MVNLGDSKVRHFLVARKKAFFYLGAACICLILIGLYLSQPGALRMWNTGEPALYFSLEGNRGQIELQAEVDGEVAVLRTTPNQPCNIFSTAGCREKGVSDFFEYNAYFQPTAPNIASATLTFRNTGNKLMQIEPIIRLRGWDKLDVVYFGGQRSRPSLSFKKDPFRKKPAEIPITFIKSDGYAFGTKLTDDYSRLSHDAIWDFISGDVIIKIRNLGIEPGAIRTITFEIHKFNEKNITYFDFINRLRQFAQPIAINGAGDFLNIIENRDLLGSPERLKRYLSMHKVRTLILVPWLDYDHFNKSDGKFISRQRYKELFGLAAKAIRDADPSIKLLGALQSNLFTPPEAAKKKILTYFSDKTMNSGIQRIPSHVLDNVVLYPWTTDDLLINKDGSVTAEVYFNGPDRIPAVALATWIHGGGQKLKQLKDQISFLTDEVMLDGFYIDQLSVAFSEESSQRYDFSRWDGVTLFPAPDNSSGYRKINDTAFAGISAKYRLIKDSLDRGMYVIANTQPASGTMSGLAIPRFVEAFWSASSYLLKGPPPPPFWSDNAKAYLATPLGLTVPHWMPEYADQGKIFENLVYNLRNGLLPFFNGSANRQNPIELPDFFPISVREIGEGFVMGEKVLVTARTMSYPLASSGIDRVEIFTKDGKRAAGSFKEPLLLDGMLHLNLKDWREIAVIYFN